MSGAPIHPNKGDDKFHDLETGSEQHVGFAESALEPENDVNSPHFARKTIYLDPPSLSGGSSNEKKTETGREGKEPSNPSSEPTSLVDKVPLKSGFRSAKFSRLRSNSVLSEATIAGDEEQSVRVSNFFDPETDDSEGESMSLLPRNYRGSKSKEYAVVPSLHSRMALNSKGRFVEMEEEAFQFQRTLSSVRSSFKEEDSMMDRRKNMSFMEIDIHEKRAVFSLDVVRRSMRYLKYSSILMSPSSHVVSQKFMEIGPNR